MANDNSLTIAERIKQCRLEHGMTQKDLAERMGISPIGISQYETGKRVPKIETVDRIAAAIGVDPAYLSNRGGENMLTTEKRPMTENDLSAIQLIVSALPELPGWMLQRWAGGVEALEALKTFGNMVDGEAS